MLRIRSYSDSEIVDGICRNDKEILLFLYTSHYARVRKYVLLNNGTNGDAEDLFQDILVFLFEKSKKGELILTGSLTAFLYVVMRNMWLKNLRSRKNQGKLEEGSPDDSDNKVDENLFNPDIGEQVERESVFFKHFNELSEDCKKVLILFIEGFTVSEVASRMGYSTGQHAKNRRYRCKISLFNKIKSDPRFKELCNGTGKDQDDTIPRW
jgi:RNA polymerase sigma factor (sigma-70 family)